tara:strand:- start:779 stop:1129 length:351 start_codon:yes stop_codon:yes gene_type:complete
MISSETQNPYLLVTQETRVQFRKVIINTGRIIEIAKPNQFYGSPEEPFSEELWNRRGKKYNNRGLDTLKASRYPPYVIIEGGEEDKDPSRLISLIREAAAVALKSSQSPTVEEITA